VQGDDALFHDLAHDVYLTGPLLPREQHEGSEGGDFKRSDTCSFLSR
jgi:hypothetical protein